MTSVSFVNAWRLVRAYAFSTLRGRSGCGSPLRQCQPRAQAFSASNLEYQMSRVRIWLNSVMARR